MNSMSPPSTDLQLVEGHQVGAECFAVDARDGIAVQAPADENRLAEKKEICTSAVARDCNGEDEVMIAANSSGKAGTAVRGCLL